MVIVSLYLSLTTLKVNGLNCPVRRHRIAKDNENKTQLYFAHRDSLKL